MRGKQTSELVEKMGQPVMLPQIDAVLAVLSRRAQQLKMECDYATPVFIRVGPILHQGLLKPAQRKYLRGRWVVPEQSLSVRPKFVR
jgi:hypothetical protein